MIEDASKDDGFVGALNAALSNDLRASSVQGVNNTINLAVRGSGGALISGLSAVTSYGWLRVNMLWVAHDHRRGGLARQMMHRAFDMSLANQCHSVWLETSNPQARAFYEAMEFTVFGVLENGPDAYPQTHSRWFLRRSLTHGAVTTR